MLKFPLQLFIHDKNPQSNRGSLASAPVHKAPDEVITLTSLDDIEWVTNAIEPEQQRGPSETP